MPWTVKGPGTVTYQGEKAEISMDNWEGIVECEVCALGKEREGVEDSNCK